MPDISFPPLTIDSILALLVAVSFVAGVIVGAVMTDDRD